jgi:hypothetical protein
MKYRYKRKSKVPDITRGGGGIVEIGEIYAKEKKVRRECEQDVINGKQPLLKDDLVIRLSKKKKKQE